MYKYTHTHTHTTHQIYYCRLKHVCIMIIRKFIFMHTHTHYTYMTEIPIICVMLFYALSFLFSSSSFLFFYISKHPPPSTISYSYMAPHSLLFFFIFHGLNMNQFNIVKGCIHVKALCELIVCCYAIQFFHWSFSHSLQNSCAFSIFYLFSSFLSWGIFRKFNFSQFKYLLAYYQTHIYFIPIPKPNNNNNKTHPRAPTYYHPFTASYHSFFQKILINQAKCCKNNINIAIKKSVNRFGLRNCSWVKFITTPKWRVANKGNGK